MPPFFSQAKVPRIGSRGAQRWQIFVMIRANSNGEWLTALATDISQTGIRLKTISPLRINQKLWVKLPNADQHSVSVAWVDGPFSGCAFSEPLAEYLLHHLRGSPKPGDPIDPREDR